MDDESRIGDNPTIKRLVQDVEDAQSFKRNLPVLSPLLKVAGVDVEEMEKPLEPFDSLLEKARELQQLPDAFNAAYGDRGWISYESLNVDVQRRAVALAKANKPDAGERLLTEHYSPKMVGLHLGRCRAIQAFKPRYPLALKALADYEAGRYYACVLVVLALLDGLVNELHEGRRGFSSEEADLTAWDSVAGHSSGLNRLARLLRKTRQKTSTEPLSIPYRNGIMHGMDLEYDNVLVAAKTWAALFAVREWALKAEQGLLDPQPPEPEPTLEDVLIQHAQNREERKLLDEWEPRTIIVGVDVPASGSPDDYQEGTPERRLVEYLALWMRKNYGHMSHHLSHLVTRCNKTIIPQIRERYENYTPTAFTLLAIDDQAAAVTVITTQLTLSSTKGELQFTARFRLFAEAEAGKAAIRGVPGSRWGLLNWGDGAPLL